MSLPSGPASAGNQPSGYRRPLWIAGAAALLVLIAVAAFLIGRNSGARKDSTTGLGATTTTVTAGRDTERSTTEQSTTDRSATSDRTSTTWRSTSTPRQSSTSRRTSTTRTQPQVDQDSGLKIVGLSKLPDQAADTYALIESDGPFPFDRDGVVFQNRERHLPKRASGWYHEYTVITPGSDDRGARRLIVGKDRTVYYTQDHYDSFVVVDVDR